MMPLLAPSSAISETEDHYTSSVSQEEQRLKVDARFQRIKRQTAETSQTSSPSHRRALLSKGARDPKCSFPSSTNQIKSKKTSSMLSEADPR